MSFLLFYSISNITSTSSSIEIDFFDKLLSMYFYFVFLLPIYVCFFCMFALHTFTSTFTFVLSIINFLAFSILLFLLVIPILILLLCYCFFVIASLLLLLMSSTSLMLHQTNDHLCFVFAFKAQP